MTAMTTTPSLYATLAETVTAGGFPVTAEELAARPEALYADFGLDSLAILELAVALGNRYGLQIPEDVVTSPAVTTKYLASQGVA